MEMPDREKVIKALEYCTHSDDCLGCIHWQKVAKGEKCTVRDDALALLKEQEVVEPKKECWWYICGNCRKQIDYRDNFCRHCGRTVKWE